LDQTKKVSFKLLFSGQLFSASPVKRLPVRLWTWQMVVICIWCALFVTSQFDIIFMFPNQRFGEDS